jgi:hypothetical protein
MKRFIPAIVAAGVAALMLMPAGLASASPKAQTAGYKGSGRTNQGGRVLLNLASSGRSIRVSVEYLVHCDNGQDFSDSVTVTGPSTPGGFRGHHLSRVKYHFTSHEAGSISGIPATLDIEIAGNIRLDTGNAKGTVQPTLTLANGNKCTSGNTPITYSARF